MVSFFPVRTEEQRKQDEAAHQRAISKKLRTQTLAKRSQIEERKPIAYERPTYNTPQYWRDFSRGWVSDQEARADEAAVAIKRKRALDSKYNQAAPPHRHDRAAPQHTKQFSKPMSTQAARDDRLTPQSKALLQVIVARTGKGRFTDTTKTTLGKIMNRCPRSIQRYVQELVKFGYIRTQTRKSRRTGFFIGMRIWIMNSVLPFFVEQNPTYDAGAWLNLFDSRRNPEETKESLTNDKHSILNTLRPEKPPWFAEYTYW